MELNFVSKLSKHPTRFCFYGNQNDSLIKYQNSFQCVSVYLSCFDQYFENKFLNFFFVPILFSKCFNNVSISKRLKLCTKTKFWSLFITYSVYLDLIMYLLLVWFPRFPPQLVGTSISLEIWTTGKWMSCPHFWILLITLFWGILLWTKKFGQFLLWMSFLVILFSNP